MSLSMYEASVPAFIRTLTQLSALLDKAESYAAAKKIDANVLMSARLYPDMFPLSRQVQIACDFAKGACARLAGKDVPSWADEEKTLADLKARIAKTLDFVKGFKPADIDGSEGRDIKLKAGGQELAFKGKEYLTYFVLPNFYFHAATAYGVLRHSGLEIGKSDFIGSAS
ncbi:MAG: DUF1993 domain-containing protein [Hyphomicrobium sp.]